MNNNDNNDNLGMTYNKFKHIISGCNTYDDAYMLYNSANLNKKEREIVMSIINSQKFDDIIMDTILFMSFISNISTYKYKEDVHDAINNIKKKLDSVHLKTIMRIADSKICRPQSANSKESCEKNTKDDDSIKNCPHCRHSNVFPKNSKYVICGYPENGYDWIGCGKDWCFMCGKMLCKSWENNELLIPSNRTHNGSCCKTHASQHNLDYRKMYCQCTNNNVKRK
jgi:hypothetical protein